MSALDDKPFPKTPLIAAFLLVGASLFVVGGTRLGLIGSPAAEAAAVPRTASPTQVRDLHFYDIADGAVRVSVAGDQDRIIPTASGGFIRGVLRSFVRDRRARGIGPEQAFRVTEWSDGAVTIEDTATRRILNLNAFGPTNRQAFIDLVAPTGTTASAGAVA